MTKRKQTKRKFGGVPSVSTSMINLFSKAELDYTAIIAKHLQVAETAKTYIVEDVA